MAKPSPNMPKIRRLQEMSDDAWKLYQERALKNWVKHTTRELAALKLGDYLYHATPAKNLNIIRQSGLLPRNPEWRPYNKKEKIPRFDSSKDGYLSMATTQAGAGAMGGISVLLRMEVQDDIGVWDFRQIAASTEVRTVIGIPPEKLEYSEDGGKTWQNLK